VNGSYPTQRPPLLRPVQMKSMRANLVKLGLLADGEAAEAGYFDVLLVDEASQMQVRDRTLHSISASLTWRRALFCRLLTSHRR